jgi:23S rRNA (uracil1939-C5)-methyltransferase
VIPVRRIPKIVRKKFPSDPFLVELDELHSDGYGLGEYGGRKIAVTGVLPAETARVQVFSKRKKLVFARPVEILDPSPDRVVSICSFSDICGGCSLHHCSSARQLAYKQSRLVEELSSCNPGTLLNPLTGPVRAYRRKARLGVKFVEKKARVLVGFREKGGKYLAEIDSCVVLHEAVGSRISELIALIADMECYRTIPQIEVAVGDDSAALVFRHLEPLSVSDVEQLKSFGIRSQMEIYLQPGGLETVHKIHPTGTEDRLCYRIPSFDLEMAFHPMDFIQVNQDINLKLIDLAAKLLEPRPGDEILDLFCGIGNFSLPFAVGGARVLGVEGSSTSVQRATENARRNGVNNALFQEADLILEKGEPSWLETSFNKVLLDPPRSGAWRVVNHLAQSRADKIVYVSCNPVTLARDSMHLVKAGFNLAQAGVIDMFPHTNHVESIALFER